MAAAAGRKVTEQGRASAALPECLSWNIAPSQPGLAAVILRFEQRCREPADKRERFTWNIASRPRQPTKHLGASSTTRVDSRQYV